MRIFTYMSELNYFENYDKVIVRDEFTGLITFNYYIKEPDFKSFNSLNKYKSECDSIIIDSSFIIYLEFLPKEAYYKYFLYTTYDEKVYRLYTNSLTSLYHIFRVDRRYRRLKNIDKLLDI